MQTHLPDVQLALRPGIVEFGWGHPDPALLPAGLLAQAAELALAQAGVAALSYGAEQGPGRLLEQVAAWLTRAEGAAPPLDQLLITGGVSHALDLLCTLLTRPGDAVLVQAPTYHLALRIFRDHGLEIVPVAGDGGDVDPEVVAAAVRELQARGHPPRFLYLVPVFANPTGQTMPAEVRSQVIALAQEYGFLVLEDDVYHELWYDAPAPPALYSMASPGPVVRLGSFAKVLAPGLRLGWLAAAPEIVQRCARSGVLDSGGGVSPFTAHVVAAFMHQGWLDEHILGLRLAYRGRRDALLAALGQHLPDDCDWAVPGGGFFTWLRLPPGLRSDDLLAAAESHGVAYVPGPRFYAAGGGENFCRLAFSLLPAAEMTEGARRLGAVFAEAEMQRAGPVPGMGSGRGGGS